jgi:hypothetical protein
MFAELIAKKKIRTQAYLIEKSSSSSGYWLHFGCPNCAQSIVGKFQTLQQLLLKKRKNILKLRWDVNAVLSAQTSIICYTTLKASVMDAFYIGYPQ